MWCEMDIGNSVLLHDLYSLKLNDLVCTIALTLALALALALTLALALALPTDPDPRPRAKQAAPDFHELLLYAPSLCGAGLLGVTSGW